MSIPAPAPYQPSSGNATGKANPHFTFSLDTPSLSSGTLDKYLKTVLGSDSTNALPHDILKSATGPAMPPLEATSVTKDTFDHPPVPATAPVAPVMLDGAAQAKDVPITAGDGSQLSNGGSGMSNQLATTNMGPGDSTSTDIIPIPRGQSYVDITEYLNMPQSEAAKKLGVPPSTLSKRWKEAVRKRKWPYRMICKIDKEIMTLLHNVPQGPNAPPLPEEIENALGQLLRKRQEELRPVVIRI